VSRFATHFRRSATHFEFCVAPKCDTLFVPDLWSPAVVSCLVATYKIEELCNNIEWNRVSGISISHKTHLCWLNFATRILINNNAPQATASRLCSLTSAHSPVATQHVNKNGG